MFAEMVVVAIVDFQFLIGQVEAGEDLVLFEDEVGDHGFLRARAQVKGAELFEAANHEGELRLEAGAGFAFVESAQEGIVLGFHDLLRVETLGQDSRQRAFADSYGTFDCNIAGQLKKISHGLEENRDSLAAYLASAHEAIVERVNRRKFQIGDFRLMLPTRTV